MVVCVKQFLQYLQIAVTGTAYSSLHLLQRFCRIKYDFFVNFVTIQ